MHIYTECFEYLRIRLNIRNKYEKAVDQCFIKKLRLYEKDLVPYGAKLYGRHRKQGSGHIDGQILQLELLARPEP